MAYSILAASPDRAASGRTIFGTVAGAVVSAGLLIFHPHIGGDSAVAPPPENPQPPVTYSNDRQVIAVGRSGRSNRCDVRGFANGVATDFEIDTGDPNTADFPGSYVRKLGVEGPLDYYELSPGTRYGKIANAHLRQIRIGSVTWDNPEVSFFSDWDYSFGDDEIPLLGLPALKMHGVNVEFDRGDTCRLTVARNRRARL